MPKQPTNDLVELIRSLSKAEKISFQQFIQKRVDEAPLYLQLFNGLQDPLIDEKKVYKDAGIPVKRISATKNYLYNIILQFLGDFHRAKNGSGVYDLIFEARILQNKNLSHQAEKILGRAKKVAIREELFPAILMCIEREYELYHETLYDEKSIKNKLAALMELESQTLEQVKELIAFKDLYAKLIAFSKHFDIAKNKEQIDQLNALENHPALTRKIVLSKSSRVHREFILSNISKKRSDPVSSLRILQKLYDENEKDSGLPHRFEELQLVIAYNILVLSIELLPYKDSLKYLERLRTLPKDLFIDHIYYTNYFFNAKLLLQLRYGMIAEGVAEVLPEFRSWMQKEKETIVLNKVLSSLFLSGQFEFLAGNINEAMEWHRKILTSNDVKKHFIFRRARIMNIIFHYEINAFDVLPHLIKSCYRDFKKENILEQGEQVLLNYIKNNMCVPFNTRKDEMAVLEELHKQLKSAPKQYAEYNLLYRIILAWLEGKIRKVSTLSIVQEKVKDGTWQPMAKK